MAILRICKKDDIPAESMKQFDLKDREFLIVQTGDQFYCLKPGALMRERP